MAFSLQKHTPNCHGPGEFVTVQVKPQPHMEGLTVFQNGRPLATTIEKSIGTRHEEGRRSAFMILVSGQNLTFEQECRLCPRLLPLTGWPEAVTRLRLPQNVACGFVG